MINHNEEEILEELWLMAENNEDSYKFLSETSKIKDGFTETFGNLLKEKYVILEKTTVKLSKKGSEAAKQIIRRHRLAEVLLSEVFDLSEKDIEATACGFEHILNPNVTESICTFLGHPRICLHGKKIPRGECCEKFRIEVKPLIVPVSRMNIGSEGTIFFMAPDSHNKLDKLSSLGLIPGKKIKLHQKKPSYVIQIDETLLAIDSVIAEEIFVKRISEEPANN